MNKFRLLKTARKGKDLIGHFCFPFYHKPPEAESTESLPVWGDSPSPNLISQGSSDSQWGAMNTCSISKSWKQPKCLLTDGWVNKTWYVHKVWANYSSMKRNEVLICATMWMHLERIMLNEKSQSQKSLDCMVTFKWNLQNRLIYTDRKYVSGCLGLRGLGVTAKS